MHSLLGFTPVGYIDPTLPVVLFSALFGISMDYEVFMLSRIAEARRGGACNRQAVAIGLVATGKIITSAAAIIVVVGLAFTTADVIIVKEIGLGLAISVFLDATLIRSLLVPATMRVLGDWNWWPARYATQPPSAESAILDSRPPAGLRSDAGKPTSTVGR
jgi:putative drug exporter of the RND superfamily